MKKALLFVAAATLFFSCSKEIEPVSEDTASSGFTFKASIENLATKADMDGSYALTWAPNDYIGVYVNNDNWGEKNQPFHNDAEKGGSQFSYEYGTFVETTANAAFFPWDGQFKAIEDEDHNNVSGTTAWFHLRSEYSDYTSAKMLTPLVAKFSYETDHYPAIEFKHAAAAVKLNITNLPKGSNTIKMTADKNITGWYSFDLNGLDAEPITECLSGSGEGDNKTITLNYAEQTSDDDVPFSFIFPVPALTTPKLAFEIKDKNGIVVWSKSLKAQASNLGRGDVLVLDSPAIEPYEKFNTVSEEWTVIGTANETSWDTDFQMVTDGSLCIAKGLTFAADGKFKVRKNGNWDVAYPAENWNIWEGEGVYDIIFDISSHDIRAVKSGECPYPTTAYAEANHHTSIKNAIDLGATETANCYVITAPGKYKIPAVKGNSSESVGAMAKTKLLWETYNNDQYVTANSVIAAVDWDVDDDYVYFKTPATLKPGNAGIAALDADGKILWSWHIWIPETALTDVGDKTVSKMYYMDRNLGALVPTQAKNETVNVQSFGMLYQWGRKDPFPGARAFNSSDRARTKGVFRFDDENLGRTEDTKFDLDSSYVHPMVFAKNNAWRTGVEQWNPGGVKSINDPCPAGYKVPDYDSSDLLWGNVTSATSFEGSDTYGWWKVGQFVFPLSSSCTGGSSMSVDYINSRLFSNDWYTSSYPQHAYAQYLYLANSSWGHDGSTRKRYASSVRCVKIDGEIVDIQQPKTITIDGAFDDWTDVPGTETTDVYRALKVSYDDDYIYIYSKRIPGSRGNELWSGGGGGKPGYYYYDFDLDNNPATGDYEENKNNYEAFLYLHIFGGTADAPVLIENPEGSYRPKGTGIPNLMEGITVKSLMHEVNTETIIESEFRLVRANFPKMGKVIRIHSWGSKDAQQIDRKFKFAD